MCSSGRQARLLHTVETQNIASRTPVFWEKPVIAGIGSKTQNIASLQKNPRALQASYTDS